GADTSGRGIGDACNGDWDGDGVPDGDDNCPKTPNGNQADLDSDGTGDACDCDIDGDEDPNPNPGCSKPDVPDNCPTSPNAGQEDLDLDGFGDACDPDRDGDQDPNDTDCRPDDASVFHGRPETCNGIDDDCDDGIDAADPDGVADGFLVADKPQCELRLGACVGSLKPAYLCVDGQFLACDDVAYRGHDPRFDGGAEVRCDGQDNDCDGTADEDFAVTLLDGTTVNGAGNTCGAGACSGGRTVCSADGKGIVCDSEPGAKPEVCDGTDNDCDGFNDASDLGAIANGFFVADPALCDEQRGSCAGVIRPATLCVDGKWQPCPAAVYAAQSALFEAGAETRCDGKDNDCDGGSDEDFSVTLLDGRVATGVGAACGTGRCAGGFTACAATGKGVFCPSEAASEQEKCNGKDDDCDGATDTADAEEIVGGFMRYDPQACGNQIGVCAGAMKPASLCADGVWKACGGAEYEAHDAAYEAGGETLCDGRDNDCSGAIDEDFSVALLNGQVVTGVGTPCGTGACKGGTTACAADGARIECPSEANRKDEVCNGADDDCDGATDAADTGDVVGGYLVHDPQACEVQAGVCAGAKKPATLCADGKWAACGAAQYAAWSSKFQADAEKSCDGLDNDCSGEADEDFSVTLLDGSTVRGTGAACGAGACAGGTTVCKADQTGTVCPTESMASHEKCVSPRADEDCDGLADADDLGDVVAGFLLWDQPACALQAGACAGSKKPAALCVNGQWQACSSVTYAAQSASYDGGTERRCDGADNDCDASTDEDFSVTLLDGTIATGVGASCGTGRCAGGKTACTADKTGIDCPFELKAVAEVCGTGDDDCDGKADAADTDDVVAGYFRYDSRDCEVQNGVCGGAKKPATLCVGGAWQPCGNANYTAHSGGTFEAGQEVHCDGLDNDCNGNVDEDFSVQLLNGVTATQVGATCGVGKCSGGQIACTANRLGIYCTKESLASAEICNAVDDDCDGMMDAADANDVVNGFLRYDAAQECELKLGVCSGAKKPAALCSNGGWLPCQAAQYVSHNPAYEANVERHCDGLDNDCNGAVDEDFTVVLKNGASVSGVGKACGVGACAGGVTKCAEDTEHILCDNESRAGDEVCNGADDDCDGKTDAADANDIVGGFFLYDTPACENQAGVCVGARKNAVLCSGGRWNACGAAQYAANSGQYQDGVEASCDALDNDCDGAADEDFSLVQLNGAIVTGVGKACGTGICTGSSTACRADKLGTRCPSESNARGETCNGLDDSCNGQTDETYTDKGKACDGGDPDSCKTGTYTCKADGTGVECVNETGTSTEKCNGADDDCDTLVDEDFPTKGAACDGSDGDLCKRGTYTCNAAGTGVECVNESPANIQEACNGQDDDCDGATDETFTTKGQPCDGSDGDLCKNGTFTCRADGTGVECVNESPANVTEKCNGVDDDCDAATDEDFTDKGKPCDGADTDWCKNGTYTCKADGYGVECVNESTQNIVDRCNGLDDDCDSLTDEDYPTKGQACDGPDADQCKLGTFTCKADGSGVECVNDATPQAETCNGLDDDCDGATDEDFPTKGAACDGADADQCKNGTNTCKANGSGVECVNESPAGITEKCNGLDDDCDTLVDEDFPTKGAACDGPDADQCKGGTFTCLANGTGVECVNDTVGNKVERCNGLDDDCDGLTDEDFPAKGQSCDGSDADQCKMGTNTCKADGSAVECVNETASYTEKCNGLDDDCDTLVDEDFPTKGAACDGSDADLCKGGTFTCKADGSTVECVNDTVGNKVEKCGGGDEDCDGMTDDLDTNDVVGGYFIHDQPNCENQNGVCSGSKKPASLCSGGVWQGCTNVTYVAYSAFFEAGVEVRCDGKDNDCSGATDEDFTMTQKNGQPVSGVNTVCGFGVCAGTRTACAANQLGIVCPGEANATTETCNGTDQDCDNVADAIDTDADVACAVVPHGTGECAGAGTACSVKTCDATWGNVNGIYGDGCECQQDLFDIQGKGPTCAAAWDLGTLSDEVSGAELATPNDSNTVLPAADEDWYKFTITDTLQNGTWASHGTEKFGFVVELDPAISDSCVRFQVYSDCSTVGTCNGSASPGDLRTFESAFTGAYGKRDCVAEAQWNCCAAGACQAGGTASDCCETAGAACGVPTDAHAVTVCSALPNATYYVKVYRSATAPCSNTGITCTNTRYKLKVRNKY
ncbi:MAG: thrombospondin type 3 repeat-containing protein, partial [Deltaproteobacteria bacterium]|nr:thrombospondin type 3 repeat-containing protein [Deltaproteobacteria bacterium]